MIDSSLEKRDQVLQKIFTDHIFYVSLTKIFQGSISENCEYEISKISFTLQKLYAALNEQSFQLTKGGKDEKN